MRTIFYILFGSAFTVTVSYGFGRIILRKLSMPDLSRLDCRLFRFLTGSAALSLLMFALCAVHLALKGVMLFAGLLILLVAFRRKIAEAPDPKVPGRLLLLVPLLTFGLIYFIYALAPEISPDGASYHLAFVARYYKWHGFRPITTNMYASMPQAMEMLFLFAYAFGRHSAAAMVHLTFLFVLALLLWSYGKRRGQPMEGAAAGAIVFLSPIFGVDASSAYNDVALAAAGFGCFYLLQIWREAPSRSILIAAGILAGFAFSLKYTGIFVLFYALVIVRRKSLAVIAPFLLITLPWLIKNAIIVHNPFSPFFNAVFPNPFIHISFERQYSQMMRHIGLTHPLRLPWGLAWDGAPGGALGLVFLLLPFGLLLLRKSDGRQLWLAATAFSLMFPFNTGTRFLMLSAPILALIITAAVPWKPVLYSLVAAQAAFAFPPVYQKLRAPTCWSMEEIPIRAALRMEPEEVYLSHRMPNYDMARFIEKSVPDSERVLAFDSVAEAYTTKNVLVYYESAEAELERDILLAPLRPDLQPVQVSRFRFTPSSVKSLDIVQIASGTDSWSMNEISPSISGSPVPYSPAWSTYTSSTPWDRYLAFDGNLATPWSTWRDIYPGMSYSIAFPQTQLLDGLEIRGVPSQARVTLRLVLSDGTERQIDHASLTVSSVPDLRRSATRAVRKRGTRFVMFPDAHRYAGEFLTTYKQWGTEMLGHWGNCRLYRLD